MCTSSIAGTHGPVFAVAASPAATVPSAVAPRVAFVVRQTGADVLVIARGPVGGCVMWNGEGEEVQDGVGGMG